MKKMTTGNPAIERARKGESIYVFDMQWGWTLGDARTLERALRSPPDATGIYGVINWQ